MASEVSSSSSVSPSTMSAESSERENCSICLESLDDKVYALACGHIFHEDCMQQWQKIRESCPLCRHVKPVVALEGPELQGENSLEAQDLPPFVQPELFLVLSSFRGGRMGAAMMYGSLVASGMSPRVAAMYSGSYMFFPCP